MRWVQRLSGRPKQPRCSFMGESAGASDGQTTRPACLGGSLGGGGIGRAKESRDSPPASPLCPRLIPTSLHTYLYTAMNRRPAGTVSTPAGLAASESAQLDRESLETNGRLAGHAAQRRLQLPSPCSSAGPNLAQPLATGIRRLRARNKSDPQSLFANCSKGNAISR